MKIISHFKEIYFCKIIGFLLSENFFGNFLMGQQQEWSNETNNYFIFVRVDLSSEYFSEYFAVIFLLIVTTNYPYFGPSNHRTIAYFESSRFESTLHCLCQCWNIEKLSQEYCSLIMNSDFWRATINNYSINQQFIFLEMLL